MKRFNLIIQDKDEKEWDFFVENKKEANVNDTIINFIRKENKKTRRKDGSK